MSDNTFSNIMSASAAANASAAASDAAAAKKAARAAQNASEERLESSGYNPFVNLEIRKIEKIEVPDPTLQYRNIFVRMFSVTPTKKKLSEKGKKVSVKRTDISHLVERTDEYGTVYTEVVLEERCNLEYSSVYVAGTLEQNQKLLNK